MAATATILARGDTLAGYRVLDIIGMGGMAIVYLAEQLSLGRPVALKVLAPQLANDADFRERFRREGKHAAALDHPHVVTIYDSGEHDGRLYMAMRLVQGTTLADNLITGGIDADETITLLAPIADALDAAHRLELIHRDVKPQNILIAANGHTYLADFGIARATTTTAGLTATGGFVGSINYAAPEQITGRPASAAGDIYALTAVLYQCLTGEVPFPRDTDAGVMHAHLHAQPPTLRMSAADAGELDRVIARGMAKHPADRYLQASELMSDAAAAIAALPRTGAAAPRVEHSAGIDRPQGPAHNGHDDWGVGAGGEAERDPNHTEVLGTDERVRRRFADDATSIDQRRVLTPVEPPPEPRPRRRWARLAPPALLVTGALAIGGVLLSGANEAVATKVAGSHEVSVSYSAPWQTTTRGSRAAQALTTPVLLTADQTSFAAGRLSRSARIPGAAPPPLVARYGRPATSATVTLGSLPARRHTWRVGDRSLVSFSLTRASTDLAVVCEAPARPVAAVRGCLTLAAEVEVSGERIVVPGADANLAHGLTEELASVSIARTRLQALDARTLRARAARARELNKLEVSQLQDLTALSPYERNRVAMRRLTDALGVEAKRWERLASAARSNRRVAYTTARESLVRASRSVAAAATTLRRDGFSIPALRVLDIPPAPAAPAAPAVKAPVVDNGSAAVAPPPPAATRPLPSQPQPSPSPKKSPTTRFGPTGKQDL